jgi:hypothetical protein
MINTLPTNFSSKYTHKKTTVFFKMGSIAPASASIDAHSYFIAIFKVLAVYKS